MNHKKDVQSRNSAATAFVNYGEQEIHVYIKNEPDNIPSF